MYELTESDREQIKQQIIEYRTQETQLAQIPTTPDGQSANKALDDAIQQEAVPDAKESKRVKKHIKGLWRKWRTTALDAKSLEIERIACQIEIKRAHTQAELNKVKREEEKERVKHWLELNKGNLEDIGYNTESKPNMFWYGLKRASYHITKLTTDVPKIVKNLFWIGAIVLGIILLKTYNII